MSKKDEALKLALAVLEEINRLSIGENAICLPAEIDTAMDAIREALAEQQSGIKQVIELYDSPEQPAQQQEPVANLTVEDGRVAVAAKILPDGVYDLYTSPPASKPWVGLTDEERDECYYWKDRKWTTDELVRYVEAKLREKNA